MNRRLIVLAVLGALSLGSARADKFSFTYTDPGPDYSGSGFLETSAGVNGVFTVTSGYFSPTGNNNQAVWDHVGNDNLLFVKAGQGYLNGTGLLFKFGGNPDGSQISIWNGTVGSALTPSGSNYSFSDPDSIKPTDGMGTFTLTPIASTAPGPAAAIPFALGLLRRRKRRA